MPSGNDMRLGEVTVAEDELAALDEDTVVALITYRYRQLLDAGLGGVPALMLAARTDRSPASITSQRRGPVGAAA
jgi:hypothetical protein